MGPVGQVVQHFFLQQVVQGQQYCNDFSWVFGLGFLTAANIGIDARYNLGPSNIEKGGM